MERSSQGSIEMLHLCFYTREERFARAYSIHQRSGIVRDFSFGAESRFVRVNSNHDCR